MKKRKTYLLNTSARSVTRSVIFTGYIPATGKRSIHLKSKKGRQNYGCKEESRKERRSEEIKF